MHKISTKFRWNCPNGGVKCRWKLKVKIAFYNRSRSLRLRCLTTEKLCPSTTVVCVHNGMLAEECAVSSTFNSDASQNLMITVTVQLTPTRLVVHWYGSLLMTATTSHACCVIVKRYVQYAGSRIKRGSC